MNQKIYVHIIKYNSSIDSAVIAQLEKLTQSTKSIAKEMEKSTDAVFDLKRSLLSSAPVGSFTELTLQNILSSAGLQTNVDCYLQPTLQEGEKLLRPDAIVVLPDDNFIIIDAKATTFQPWHLERGRVV